MKGSPVKLDSAAKAVVTALWLSLGVFVVFPFVRLLWITFTVDGAPSLGTLIPVATNWYNQLAFRNSLLLGLAVATCGTALGFLFAYGVTRLHLSKPFIWIINAVVMLPLISPPFTSSIALTLSLGPNGTLLKLFGLKSIGFYGFSGTFISETLTYFPIAYMTLATVLSRLDPNLEDAAYSMGASPWRTFRTVTLPLSLPGVANSFLLLFAASLADFATPLVLAGHSFPVLPTQAYLQITGLYDLKGGAALSFMLLAPALAVYALQHLWLEKKSFVTISGKSGGRSSVKGPGPAARTAMMGVMDLVLAFVLYLYGLILWGSVVKVWGVNPTPTLQNYAYVFSFGWKAIMDTLLVALIATPLGGLLAVFVGTASARWKIRGRKTLETVSLLNYALPGTVVGIAYVVAFNSKPLVLTGTISVLVAAYVFRYASAGIRQVIATMQQIDPSIEEASASLGAGSGRTFRLVTLPLVLPAVLSGMKYLFIHSMTAISATIFLVSVRWSLLTTRILECMTELQFAHACAFSIVLILIVFVAGGVLNLLARALYRGRGVA